MPERGDLAWFEDVLHASEDRLNAAEARGDAPVWWWNGELLSPDQVTERIRGNSGPK